nr:SAM-dependent methyltransferase [Microtetraspora sp. NBRC 13810]
MGILGMVGDYDEARSVVSRLMAALPTGSCLALYDGTDTVPDYVRAMQGHNSGNTATPYTPRSPEQIAGFFEGLDVLDPGVVQVPLWRPEPALGEPPSVPCWGGVGRKR